MFERYTERARRVIFFARYEASQFGSTIIEAEHFLLGLIREDNRFVRSSSALESIRSEIAGRRGVREKVPTSIDLPLSTECKRILAYAYEEAELLNNRYVSTVHLLLGILREETCLAAEILVNRGLRLDAIREELAAKGEEAAFVPPASPKTDLTPDVQGLVSALEKHGFMASRNHLSQAVTASEKQDWTKGQTALKLFFETVVDAIKEKLKGDDASSIFEGFDWRSSVLGFQPGLLPADQDWRFRFALTLRLAELLLKRFEQRLNS